MHIQVYNISPEIMVFALVTFLTFHLPSPFAGECYHVASEKHYQVILEL